MRGTTETVRGSSKTTTWPEQRSQIGKRNASENDLGTARKAIGKIIQMHERGQLVAYRIADVRLDSLKRLIVDLVREQEVVAHAHDA